MSIVYMFSIGDAGCRSAKLSYYIFRYTRIDTGSYDDTQLKEEVDRYRDQRHGKHIGRRCDDRCQDQDDDDCMAAVFTHEVGGDDLELGQEEDHHRQLKYDTCTEHHHGDEADIVIQCK